MRTIPGVLAGAVCCAVVFAGCSKKEFRKDVGPIKEAQVKAEDMQVIKIDEKIEFRMVRVAPGKFTMSAPDGENYGNEVAHTKQLTREYYIGQTEVTQAQYNAVIEAWKKKNPEKWAKLYPEKWSTEFANNKFGEFVKPAVSNFSKDGASKDKVKGINTANYPVENISWIDAMDFCMMLNELGFAPKGWKFSLPTESQWEFAARGGNVEKDKNFKYSGGNDINNVAWCKQNSNGRTKEVGVMNAADKRSCNGLGLYDMTGNVAEWCLDSWKNRSSETPAEIDENWFVVSAKIRGLIRIEIEEKFAKENKRSPRQKMTPEFKKELDKFSKWRVYRGGSWNGNDQVCRVANRGAVPPYQLTRSVKEDKATGKSDITYTVSGYPHIGFRLVLVPVIAK